MLAVAVAVTEVEVEAEAKARVKGITTAQVKPRAKRRKAKGRARVTATAKPNSNDNKPYSCRLYFTFSQKHATFPLSGGSCRPSCIFVLTLLERELSATVLNNSKTIGKIAIIKPSLT